MDNRTAAKKVWTTPRITDVASMVEAQGNKGAVFMTEGIITFGGVPITIGPAS